ncbi:hypothetical protein BC833DRAFT_599592 [Globomyces pollinis-pini]|nr:hypothetical protein BC833DRAFT_599592 [Globomyces pollinis-pini]
MENPRIIPEDKDTPVVQAPENRYFWNGNFNIYFLLMTILCLWFTIGRGIPFMINAENYGSPKIDWVVGFHLVNAFVTVWIMIWNLFHTPSHGPNYRMIHKILGRCSMVTGIISTLFGVIVVWFTQELGNPVDKERIGFSIGITIGGVLQVGAQIRGFIAIRNGDVKSHQSFMTGAFFGGCCIPAIIRLPQMFGFKLDAWPTFCWLFGLIFGYLSLSAMRAKRIY